MSAQEIREEWEDIQVEIHSAEEDIREANKRLHATNKRRDDLIANILFGVL